MSTGQFAHIYMRGKYYYIVPHSTTTSGLSVGVEPITVLESGISDEIFGENIMAIFAFSKKNIPHPTNPAEWSQNLKPLLVAAKVRSWKAFMSGAELISLINIDGTIKLEPWINGGVTGPQRGFTPNEEKAHVLSADSSFTELGKTVKNIFQTITSES